MKDFNPFDLCEQTSAGFAAMPAVVYPAVIARIKQIRQSGEIPAELGDADAAKRFMAEYSQVKDAALDAALQPFDEFDVDDADQSAGAALKRLARALRADALGFAADFFSRSLAISAGKGIRIHWQNNPDFKI